MLVWRIETNCGVGLFTNNRVEGEEGHWSPRMWSSKFLLIPAPFEDFYHEWDEAREKNKRLRFAFPNPAQINVFVGPNKRRVIKGLQQAGFSIVVLDVTPLLRSSNQVVYDPLYAVEIRRLNPKKLYAYTA